MLEVLRQEQQVGCSFACCVLAFFLSILALRGSKLAEGPGPVDSAWLFAREEAPAPQLSQQAWSDRICFPRGGFSATRHHHSFVQTPCQLTLVWSAHHPVAALELYTSTTVCRHIASVFRFCRGRELGGWREGGVEASWWPYTSILHAFEYLPVYLSLYNFYCSTVDVILPLILYTCTLTHTHSTSATSLHLFVISSPRALLLVALALFYTAVIVGTRP